MQILLRWIGNDGLRVARHLQRSLPALIDHLDPRVPAVKADPAVSVRRSPFQAGVLIITEADVCDPQIETQVARLTDETVDPMVFNLSGRSLPAARQLPCYSAHRGETLRFLRHLAKLSGSAKQCTRALASEFRRDVVATYQQQAVRADCHRPRTVWGLDPDELL